MIYTTASHQGGDIDALASLLGSCHVCHPHLQSIGCTHVVWKMSEAMRLK